MLAVAITAFAALSNRGTSAETLSARNAEGAVTAVQADDYRVIGVLDDPLAFYHDNASNFSDTWNIPITAPIETFPDTPTYEGGLYTTCSKEQVAWLREHALEASPSGSGQFDLTLQNNAADGGALSVTDLRFDGEEVPSEPLVHFGCPVGGRGMGPQQQMLVDIDGSSAVWSAPTSEGEMPEGSLVTVNLAPGEATPVRLIRSGAVDRQRQYAGRFLADIEGETVETVVLAADVEFTREAVPRFFLGYGVMAQADGLFRCGVPSTGPQFEGDETWEHSLTFATCSVQDAVDILRRASDAVAG